MSRLIVEHQDDVAVVSLSNGVINAIDEASVDELAQSFDAIADDTAARALVLTSGNDKFFSIGLDLPSLLPMSEDDFRRYYAAFNRMCLQLFTFPKPTVAAITGHATGGGYILALCCDYRLIASGRKLLGLPEIELGVPLPYVSDCILRSLVSMRAARDIAESGRLLEPEEAVYSGLVDAICAPETLLEQAIELARRQGNRSQLSLAMLKRNRTEKVAAEIRSQLDEREEYFIACWFSPDTQRRLKEARRRSFDRSLSRG